MFKIDNSLIIDLKQLVSIYYDIYHNNVRITLLNNVNISTPMDWGYWEQIRNQILLLTRKELLDGREEN